MRPSTSLRVNYPGARQEERLISCAVCAGFQIAQMCSMQRWLTVMCSACADTSIPLPGASGLIMHRFGNTYDTDRTAETLTQARIHQQSGFPQAGIDSPYHLRGLQGTAGHWPGCMGLLDRLEASSHAGTSEPRQHTGAYGLLDLCALHSLASSGAAHQISMAKVCLGSVHQSRVLPWACRTSGALLMLHPEVCSRCRQGHCSIACLRPYDRADGQALR